MDEFQEVLVKYKNKPFLVIEPGGNNGDKLIYLGLEKLLKSLNVTYQKVVYLTGGKLSFLKLARINELIEDMKDIMEKTARNSTIVLNRIEKKIRAPTLKTNTIRTAPEVVIVVNGGANMNDYHGHGLKLIKELIEQNQKNTIIIAPQTYYFESSDFSKLLQNAKQDIYLFCREKYSYNILCSMQFKTNISVHLSPDTAFYLTKDDLVRDISGKKVPYDLLCIRTDNEANLPLEKIVKKVGGSGNLVCSDVSLSVDFEKFLEIVEGANKIYTDRIHVAILGSIFEKTVFLFPNSYFKNIAIYQYSLKAYEKTMFINSLTELDKPLYSI